MKLLRYGPSGREKPGLLDADGRIRDLSSIVSNIDSGVLAPSRLAHLRGFDPAKLPKVAGTPRLGVPYTGIGKFIAIGLNYSDHAAESGMPVPAEPIVFMKATTCITGPNDGITLPKGSTKTDWEVELGVVIGTKAQYVDKADALRHVAGYCVINDVSERHFQSQLSGQWTKGKSCDTFGPTGPWLVTRDEVPDPQALELWLDVNGVRRQTGTTATMIFTVATIIEHLSSLMTLHPGDVIFSGTPPMSVGPVVPGDVINARMDSIGEFSINVFGGPGRKYTE